MTSSRLVAQTQPCYKFGLVNAGEAGMFPTGYELGLEQSDVLSQILYNVIGIRVRILDI